MAVKGRIQMGSMSRCSVTILCCVLCTLVLRANEGICSTTGDASGAEDAVGAIDRDSLRFQVPFAALSVHGLDLESAQDLRVRAVKDAAENAQQTCTDPVRIDPVPSVQPTDRLVAVDGVAVSLQSLREILEGPTGQVAVIPLFKPLHGDGAQSNRLSGFARVELFHPNDLTFKPTSAAREQEIRVWKTQVAKQQQEELERQVAAANDKEARDQEEKERQAAEANAKIEKQAREVREKEEYERMRMTPHDQVRGKRNNGKEFRYEVEFVTKGPIGLNWDLHTTDRTVVSHLEPKMPAEKLNVIAPKDQLIQLNDLDTSAMGPYEVVQAYLATPPPRKMVFKCDAPVKKTAQDLLAAASAVSVQNWTLAFTEPAVLRGWRVRLHVAPWSREPELEEGGNLTAKLVQTNPTMACVALPQRPAVSATPKKPVVYLVYRGECTFIDKAKHVKNGGGDAVIVVNNVKGEGRFSTFMPAGDSVELPVTMVSKLEGELIMSVLEHEEAEIELFPEDPSDVPTAPVVPPRLTNEQLTVRRDVKKAGQTLKFWYINASAPSAKSAHTSAFYDFQILPGLFGATSIPTIPYRVVNAYPLETACHIQGLGVLATRSVVLVKRGGCSFGTKLRVVQDAGGAGMLMINSDNSLLPLMSDPKEATGLMIWAATIGLDNGAVIQEILARNKNLPSMVKVVPREEPLP